MVVPTADREEDLGLHNLLNGAGAAGIVACRAQQQRSGSMRIRGHPGCQLS